MWWNSLCLQDFGKPLTISEQTREIASALAEAKALCLCVCVCAQMHGIECNCKCSVHKCGVSDRKRV